MWGDTLSCVNVIGLVVRGVIMKVVVGSRGMGGVRGMSGSVTVRCMAYGTFRDGRNGEGSVP